MRADGRLIDEPQDSRGEIMAARTLRSKVFDMGEGKRRFQATPFDQCYVDDKGDVRSRRLLWTEQEGIWGCETDARKVYVLGPGTFSLVHRNGSEIVSTVALSDGTSFGDVTPVLKDANILDYEGVLPDVAWRIALTPGPVRNSIWLFSDAAPRDWTWTLEGVDISKHFQLEDNHAGCRANVGGGPEGAARGTTAHPWLEIDEMGGPEIERLPSGLERITIRKRWTGRVSATRSLTRVSRWEDVPVIYPVKIE